jgi:hypothetical protein
MRYLAPPWHVRSIAGLEHLAKFLPRGGPFAVNNKLTQSSSRVFNIYSFLIFSVSVFSGAAATLAFFVAYSGSI